ncbi:proprotein convertase subtilisin/kexin type 7-like [Watersipora subatra]|uniref:proprotein convertase subtilisin/kexin type 7-like n=1 Tax=Watersipora subatra TaxID=2589382 RepID=UPI00355C7C36
MTLALALAIWLALSSLSLSKLVLNHIDWKGSHAETMLYAIKLRDFADKNTTSDLLDAGLVHTSPCLFIDDCYIYTHTYHFANGSCAFSNTTCAPAVRANKEHLHGQLNKLKDVEWYAEIWERHRFKRRIKFNDANYTKQWHLHPDASNSPEQTVYLNVSGVWALGVTGRNVTVAVVDDGLEWDNPDLKDNYNPEGSIDLNDHDNDPMPNELNGKPIDHNEHGTRCAGEIAAVANNGICGVGIAYEASISGVRALDGSMTDLLERDAFAAKHAINDIYSCSWGPEDDGETVDGPHTLAKAAIRNGIMKGRNGYGSIYVVASGNGGKNFDNCNFDGYANSMYFVTIGAVDRRGKKPVYAEDCSSMLAVTPSGDGTSGLVTTDVTHRPQSTGCTNSHSGTSAAAPLAAGVIALVLSVNPCLSWRDIQHLIVLTSVKVDEGDPDWRTNAAGLNHSHKHGFGLISPWNIVNAAKVWKQVPALSSFTKEDIHLSQSIMRGQQMTLSYPVSAEDLQNRNLNILEYVEVTVTITHEQRGNLMIELKCPNTEDSSVLASYRPYDKDSKKGFQAWTFSTVKCWGERPAGLYQLVITDKSSGSLTPYRSGTLETWSLSLHGSSLTPERYQAQINDAYESRSGHYLRINKSVECKPPLYDVNEPQQSVHTKVLQIIVIVGSFLTIATIFNLVEDYVNKTTSLSTDQQTLLNNKIKTCINPNGAIEFNCVNTSVHIPLDDTGPAAASPHSTDEEDYTDASSNLETTALLVPG